MPLESAQITNENTMLGDMSNKLRELADRLQWERDETRLENHQLRGKLVAERNHHMRTIADRDRLHCEAAELRGRLNLQNVKGDARRADA